MRAHACIATLEGELAGHHWEVLRQLLPIYQAITTVQIGDGATTSFWHDVWQGDECFADRFPALLTHCRKHNQTVRTIVEDGLERHLVPRVSTIAQAQLQTLRQESSSLGGCSRAIGSKAEPTCKHGRSSRTRSVRNAAVKLKQRPIYIMFECSFARSFWTALGFTLPHGHQVRELHTTPRPDRVPEVHYEGFILLCCWQLWKRRNGLVFRDETMNLRQILVACREEARLWSYRMHGSSREVSQTWCSVFSSAM